MGQITVNINNELETSFRVIIAKQGGKKGNLSRAIEEAMKLWIQKNQ